MRFDEKLAHELPSFLEGDGWLFFLNSPAIAVLVAAVAVLLFVALSRVGRAQRPLFFAAVLLFLGFSAWLQVSPVSQEWHAKHDGFVVEALSRLHGRGSGLTAVVTRRDVMTLRDDLQNEFSTNHALEQLLPNGRHDAASAPDVQRMNVEDTSSAAQ